MKVIINLFCDGFADTGDPFDLRQPCPCHCSRRAEMVQQGMLAFGANAGDFVERRLPDRLGTLGAMSADRKAMRFVAQALQEVEDRIAWFEPERRPTRYKKPL